MLSPLLSEKMAVRGPSGCGENFDELVLENRESIKALDEDSAARRISERAGNRPSRDRVKWGRSSRSKCVT